MKQRGRTSAAASAIGVAFDGTPSRLQPPDHLSADERQRFVAIVANCDAAHFRPTDLPLLCRRYVEADALAENAMRELRKNAVSKDGKPSGWLMVQEKSVRTLTALSMRLRLSPQARLDPKTLRRQPLARPSAYDTREWEFLDDDHRNN